MIEQTRGLSYVRYDVDSAQTRFHLPFDYLAREHVSATTQQGEDQTACPLTWVDARTVEIVSPASPYVLIVRRSTPVDREWVEYRDGAKLPARELRQSFQQLLYAHQERLEGGAVRHGASTPPGSGGDFTDLDDLIDKIIRSPALKDLITAVDPIERSPILQDILAKIALIDLNAITLMEDILRSTHFHDLTRQHGAKISTAFHQLTLLDEGLKVTATSLTDLFARVDGVDNSQQAQYQDLMTAIADEVSARVSALSELHAQMLEGDEAVSVALAQQISEAEVTAEQARASLQTTLAAAIMDGDTAVSQALHQTISEAVATAEAARASLKTFLEAQIADGDTALSTAINHRIDGVEADAAGARASMQDTLQTQFTNADNAVTTALVQQISEAVSTAEAARASLKTDLQAQFVAADNTVSVTINNRIDEVEASAEAARASSTAHLQAQIDDGATARAALNLRVDEVEVSAEASRALLKEQLQAQIVSGDGAVSSALNTRIDTVETNAGQALASAVDLLYTSITENGESISDALNGRIDTVEANTESAIATTTTQLQAQIADSNAAMQEQVTTKVTAAQAETIAQTKVQAFQNNHFALLQQEFNVVAGEHAGMYGQWQANYSVKINAGTVGGKPVMAGIALSANPETGSDFIVMSDRFAVVPPSYTNSTQPKMPFVVGHVNGVTTVGIQGQLLVDGSITTNKITANTLSAITANMGTVNGGTFKTHTLDANGNVTNPTEFRAEISNVGNWPLWIGSGTKTANNAVVWIDKQGNAEFKGKIKAGNVVGQFQSSTAVNWSGAIALDYPLNPPTLRGRYSDPQVVTSFTLNAPVQVGETHIPSIVLRVVLNFKQSQLTTDGNVGSFSKYGVRVLLEELDASVWKTVYTYNSPTTPVFRVDSDWGVLPTTDYLYVGSEEVLIIANSAPTTSPRQFRIRARLLNASGNHYTPSPCEVIKVEGRVTGLR